MLFNKRYCRLTSVSHMSISVSHVMFIYHYRYIKTGSVYIITYLTLVLLYVIRLPYALRSHNKPTRTHTSATRSWKHATTPNNRVSNDLFANKQFRKIIGLNLVTREAEIKLEINNILWLIPRGCLKQNSHSVKFTRS